MRLLLAGLGATALLAGSCGAYAEHTSADRPSASRSSGAPSDGDRPVEPGGDPGTDVPAREPVPLGRGCTSPDGVSVSYPDGWSVNTGEVTPACTRFAPQAFSLPQDSDLRVAAITITTESMPFERAGEPPAGQESRTPLTVDGHEAVRIQQHTADGLYPLGTPITSYVVDLGVWEDGPRTLIVTTVGLPRFDYAGNVEVLDEIVGTLRLPPDGQN